MSEVTINTKEISDYIGVPYQTFQSWMKRDVLSMDNLNGGRGHPREYTLNDIVCARIVKAVLDRGNSYFRARNLTLAFRYHMERGTYKKACLVLHDNDESSFVTTMGDLQNMILEIGVYNTVINLTPLIEEAKTFINEVEKSRKELTPA